MDEEQLSDDHPKATRQDRRDRMKKWATSRPEFAIKRDKNRDARGSKTASRHVERDLDGARERDEQSLSPKALQERYDTIAKDVQLAWLAVPTSLNGKLTLSTDFYQLGQEVKGSTGDSLEERRSLSKRLEEFHKEAARLLELVTEAKEVVEWADAHPWRTVSAPLGRSLDQAATALAELDGRSFKAAVANMQQLQIEWDPIEEAWEDLQRRYGKIASSLQACEQLAKGLPETKALAAALKLCAEAAPLAQPLTLSLATSKGGLTPLTSLVGQLEPLCLAFDGVPTIAGVLASATPPRFPKWPERTRLLETIANALGGADASGLAKAVTALADLVALANNADLDVAALTLVAKQIGQRADVVRKTLDTATGGAADSERWEAIRLLDDILDALRSGLTPLLVPADPRARMHQDLGALTTWVAACENACSDAELLRTLKQAYDKSTKLTTAGGTARIKLCGAFGTLADTANVIADAYDALLDCKGPWSQGQKAAAAAPPISQWLQLTWGYTPLQADPLALALARIDRQVTTLFTSAGLTAPTFTALRAALNNSLSATLTAVRAYPRQATLAHYVTFLTHKAVSPANLASLVAAQQVHLDTTGHRNPFRYYCGRCGMHEAEAMANVTWVHGTGQLPEEFWGVVHVHYHGQAVTTPDAHTFYHVKPSNFGAPSGQVVDGASIAAVDHVIPNGVHY